MGRPLSPAQIERIRDRWRLNVSPQRIADEERVSMSAVLKNCHGVERPPCGCGRAANHKGHCLTRAAANPRVAAALARAQETRETWTDAADDILRSTYAAGVEIGPISDAVSAFMGFPVSTVAIASRVARLDLHRPAWFMSSMGRTGKVGWGHHPQPGRKPGPRPKPVLTPEETEEQLREYHARKAADQRRRNARIRAERDMAQECDLIFAHLVAEDMLETERLSALPRVTVPPPPVIEIIPVPAPAPGINGSQRIGHAPRSIVSVDRAKSLDWLSNRALGPARTCQTVIDPGSFGIGIRFCGAPSVSGKSWCSECASRYFIRWSQATRSERAAAPIPA